MAMKTISVKTGDVSYQLTDEAGNVVGVLRFNPYDPDIIRRSEEFKKWASELKLSDELSMKDLLKLSDEVRERFDLFLNRKASEELFKANSPIAILDNGEFYFQQMITIVRDIIEDVVKNRNKKIDAAVKDIVGE